MRGYFEIGVYHPKREANVGTLWRSAMQLGAAGIFIIGPRYKKQSSDTVKAWQHIPLRTYADWYEFSSGRPYNAQLIAVEMGGIPLTTFTHPERAVYLLGAEDHGIPPEVLEKCQHVVSIEAMGQESYNLAVAGSLVMYDRMVRQ
jgi:tRNA G18 (ribose-2'-O)-methylase SpoU